MMTTAEYAKFLDRLDESITSWQQRIKEVSTAKISVDAREELEGKCSLALMEMKEIHARAAAEREHVSLGTEIMMSNSLQTIMNLLSEVSAKLSYSREKHDLIQVLASIKTEVDEYAVRLSSHAISKADDFEYRIADCTPAAIKPH